MGGFQVMVVVDESNDFEFVLPDRSGRGGSFVDHVFVESQGGASVHVPIRPLVLGEVPISAEAMTPLATDSVVRTLMVKVRRSRHRKWVQRQEVMVVCAGRRRGADLLLLAAA